MIRDLADVSNPLAQSQTFHPLQLMPLRPRCRTASLDRLLQDTVATLTMIDPSPKVAQPIRLPVPLDQVDETLMKLFVSSVVKVSMFFILVTGFNPLVQMVITPITAQIETYLEIVGVWTVLPNVGLKMSDCTRLK
jgi:hypothetical protein